MTRRGRGRLVDATGTLDRLAEILGRNPTGADRFGRWLDEQENSVPDVQTGIRLPQRDLDRADALVETLADDAALASVGAVTRSGVLRLALGIGLTQLERDPDEALGRVAVVRVRMASGAVVTVAGDGEAVVEAAGLLGEVVPAGG